MGGAYDGFGGRAERSLADSQPAWAPGPRAAAGAPNVVVVLCDDLGYSDLGCYGSEIATPYVDGLAGRGVRLANYHVTPLCSPTRAALLTGVNPHRAGVGYLAIEDHGFPGYRGRLTDAVVTAAELFRHNGYTTLAAGKWHLTPRSEMSEAADRSSWPLQRGFDRYYGYLGGLTNWHQPHLLHEDNHVVQLDRYPDGYYFADDVTERAIAMVRAAKVADPGRPFFLYLAHGAVHAPLLAKPEDVERHRGRYGAGWDELREARHRRQLELGVLEPGTEPAPRNDDVPAWDSLSAEEQAFAARQMEVYAAMVDNVDRNLGRLCEALAALGVLDDTLIVFSSDNGASPGGGPFGTTAYLRHGYTAALERRPGPRELERAALVGGPRAMTHYAWGWATASNTPFRLYKGTTFAGGHQVPLVLSWPRGLAERGAIRRQWTHVTDVLPTLVELLGLAAPAAEVPMTGASFAPALADPEAPAAHDEQYGETQGHRSFYRRGQELVSLHRPGEPLDEPDWQLYDLVRDPTQREELSAREPGRVRELAAAWDEAAWANGVFPLGDLANGLYRLRRPGAGERQAVTLTPADHTYEPNLAKALLRGRSLRIVVSLEHGDGDEGMLVAHGDQGGGYALYVEDGALVFAVNDSFSLVRLEAGAAAGGVREIAVAIDAHEDGTWDAAVLVDGEPRGRIESLPPWTGHTPLEGIDVGIDRRSPVCWDVYERHGPFRYSGALHSVAYLPG